MSDRSRDETLRHPADEREADQSTQSASGLGRVRPGPGAQVDKDVDVGGDVLNRNAPARYDTPRQYEENNPDDQTRDR